MNILLVGSGGREHALAWKMAQSPICKQLYIAPGNAGTSAFGQNVPIEVTDIEGLRQCCIDKDIHLVVVGPEAPLVEGLTDQMRIGETKDVQVIGPSAAGAMLEGSKAFAKKFMLKYGIPTASYFEVNKSSLYEGFAFLESLQPPYVLKADGLAAGKGVLICDDITTAKNQLAELLDGKFGKASEKVVIEEFLSGIEFSVFALTDGKDYILLPEAKDYKRVGEGDSGLNTGGMGAVSPVPFVDDNMWEKVKFRIVEPTIKGIAAENMDYTGFVFFGLISVNGNPMVIEYNCRMGDPETEVVIPRIKSDLVDIFISTTKGRLAETKIEIIKDAAATIMMVSGGYPGDFEKGKVIKGIPEENKSIVFQAGTTVKSGEIVTNGGRVLAVTTMDPDFRIAVKKSLKIADQIEYQGKYYRRDIGFDL
jgi:phosphoribosylamine---glycine ligase